MQRFILYSHDYLTRRKSTGAYVQQPRFFPATRYLRATIVCKQVGETGAPEGLNDRASERSFHVAVHKQQNGRNAVLHVQPGTLDTYRVGRGQPTEGMGAARRLMEGHHRHRRLQGQKRSSSLPMEGRRRQWWWWWQLDDASRPNWLSMEGRRKGG